MMVNDPMLWTGIRMVWLDLDDTLWDFAANSHEALGEVYHQVGLARFWDDTESWRDDYHEVNARLWKLYAPGKITRDFLRMERFREPLVQTGRISDGDARALSVRLDELYLALLARKSKLVEWARELLTRLCHAGYRVGILSNGFKEVQYGKMRSSDIERYIDTVVLSDEIDINKPDERIYRYAEEKAGVTAAESMMIGDNPDTDILGAVNAGWRAILFAPSSETYTPDYLGRGVAMVSSLSEIVPPKR